MKIILAMGLILSAPSLLDAQSLRGPNPRDVEFAASLRIDLDNMTETESGLFYRDDTVGTGEPAVLRDTLMVNCRGYLADGEVFYVDRLTATIGTARLIAGFTEGLLGLRAGGKRTIVIPADLAYGSEGTEGVPPDAVLVFTLEVLLHQRAQG